MAGLRTSSSGITVSRFATKISQSEKRTSGRQDVQELMAFLTSRYPSAGTKSWARTRQFFYRNADKLSVFQVRQLTEFLDSKFDETTQVKILQEIPTIFRRDITTFLSPTSDFLCNRYGDDCFREAVGRNPKLLLTRGVGYDAGVLDMAKVFLSNELQLSDRSLQKLMNDSPFIFALPVSKLLSVTSFLRSIFVEDGSLSSDEINKIVGKIVVSRPELLSQSVDNKLQPCVELLRSRCHLEDGDLSSVVTRKSASILGLSIEKNLVPTIQLLEQRLKPADLRKCILSHAQILCLSISNLKAKLDYFDSIDESPPALDESLSSRVLVRAPNVFSLNLENNIRPKVNFLANVWGLPVPPSAEGGAGSLEHQTSLVSLLKETPTILSVSLEGNLRPTVNFFNRTGYVFLDNEWRPREKTGMTPSALRPRYLCASLFNRLLPRYHFWMARQERDGTMSRLIPVHILVAATDASFCESLDVKTEDFASFRREAIPRLKFSSQFDTWLKTGRPMDSSFTIPR